MAGRERRVRLAIGQKLHLVAGATIRLIRSHPGGSILLGISSEGDVPIQIEKHPHAPRPPGKQFPRLRKPSS